MIEQRRHPLEAAIEYVEDFQVGVYTTEGGTSAFMLEISGNSALALVSPRSRLPMVAICCKNWLLSLGIEDPYSAMRVEYDRARAKHGERTLDSSVPTAEQRYYALLEEVGEIARALTYDREHAGALSEEITQLGGLALAWLAFLLSEDVKGAV